MVEGPGLEGPRAVEGPGVVVVVVGRRGAAPDGTCGW